MIRLIGSQANIYHTYERCLQHENQLYKSYAIGQGEISLTATKINVDQLAILAKYRPTLDVLQAEREGNTDDIFVATLTTSAKVFVNEWNTTNLEVTVNAENCVKLKVPSDRVMILQRCAEFSFLYFIDESSSEITSPHEWVDMRMKENPDMTLTFSCKLKTDRIIPNMIANSWKVQSSGISSTIMRTAPVEGYLNDINMINELAGLLILDDSQLAAVLKILGQPLAAIWGPPGTGKTRVIGAALAIYAVMKVMEQDSDLVCVTSTVNSAVDEMLEEFIGSLDAMAKKAEKGAVLTFQTRTALRVAANKFLFQPMKCRDERGWPCAARAACVSAVVPAVHRDYGAHMEVRRHERKYSLSRNARKYAEFVFMTSDMLILKGRSKSLNMNVSNPWSSTNARRSNFPCHVLR